MLLFSGRRRRRNLCFIFPVETHTHTLVWAIGNRLHTQREKFLSMWQCDGAQTVFLDGRDRDLGTWAL